jgi:hypothetical protein
MGKDAHFVSLQAIINVTWLASGLGRSRGAFVSNDLPRATTSSLLAPSQLLDACLPRYNLAEVIRDNLKPTI